MEKSRLVSRTILTSSVTLGLTMISALSIFLWVGVKIRDNVISEGLKKETEAIQFLITDAYMAGDLIGMRKNLDTFARMNQWYSGFLRDASGNELWRVSGAEASESESYKIEIIRTDVRTPTGGTIGALEIAKDLSFELERWNEQQFLFLLLVIGLTLMILAVQNLTLFRIMKPLSDLVSTIREEAENLQIKLTATPGEDEVFLLKRWFAQVSYSWAQEKARAAAESRFLAIGEIAAQVAHDIRSPLAALNAVMSSSGSLPEDERTLLRMAAGRITDIANNLIVGLNKGPNSRAESHPSPPQMVWSSIERQVSEARLQLQARPEITISVHPENNGIGLFIRASATELRRVLSNLINNAAEAISTRGAIELSAVAVEGRVVITVRDDGAGIPSEIIGKLGEKGLTHGKRGGSGLGLYHARTTMEAWGGSMAIHSKPGRGTRVDLLLPQSRAPSWYFKEISIPRECQVVVMDDDPMIHQIWKSRIEQIHHPELVIQLIHFTDRSEFSRFLVGSSTNRAETLFLVDFDIGDPSHTGLDLIASAGIAEQSILVTGQFDDAEIQARCEAAGIRLLPKPLAASVPIRVVGQKN